MRELVSTPPAKSVGAPTLLDATTELGGVERAESGDPEGSVGAVVGDVDHQARGVGEREDPGRVGFTIDPGEHLRVALERAADVHVVDVAVFSGSNCLGPL